MNRRINSPTDPTVSVGEAVSLPTGNGAAAVASSGSRKIRWYQRVDSFPPVMPLGQFLFEYLYRRGVRHSFGIPGDFALPTFTWLEKSKIQNITMTHEPAAGFAADAYSRINGIGLVCVTYLRRRTQCSECHRRCLCREIAGCRRERRSRPEGSRKRSAPSSQG